MRFIVLQICRKYRAQDSQPGECVNLRSRLVERVSELVGADDRFGWIEVGHGRGITRKVVAVFVAS